MEETNHEGFWWGGGCDFCDIKGLREWPFHLEDPQPQSHDRTSTVMENDVHSVDMPTVQKAFELIIYTG